MKKEKPVGYKSPQCKYCGRKEELRFGGCFDCADIEAMFIDREDIEGNNYEDWNKGELLAYIIRKVLDYK